MLCDVCLCDSLVHPNLLHIHRGGKDAAGLRTFLPSSWRGCQAARRTMTPHVKTIPAIRPTQA